MARTRSHELKIEPFFRFKTRGRILSQGERIDIFLDRSKPTKSGLIGYLFTVTVKKSHTTNDGTYALIFFDEELIQPRGYINHEFTKNDILVFFQIQEKFHKHGWVIGINDLIKVSRRSAIQRLSYTYADSYEEIHQGFQDSENLPVIDFAYNFTQCYGCKEKQDANLHINKLGLCHLHDYSVECKIKPMFRNLKTIVDQDENTLMQWAELATFLNKDGDTAIAWVVDQIDTHKKIFSRCLNQECPQLIEKVDVIKNISYFN